MITILILIKKICGQCEPEKLATVRKWIATKAESYPTLAIVSSSAFEATLTLYDKDNNQIFYVVVCVLQCFLVNLFSLCPRLN